uniref:Uncharacterized protein n=1 Tax=Rhabditophanes sp. KR3021 TaxID=114890 RepID=A0AC35U9G1_9BILA
MFFPFIFTLFVAVATTPIPDQDKSTCLISFNPHVHRPPIAHDCPLARDSCVKLFRIGDVSPRYECLSKFSMFGTAFTNLSCTPAKDSATCFRSDSVAYGHTAFNRHFTDPEMGEVLHRAGIDKFCCCSGNECSSSNLQMEDYFIANDVKHEHHQHIPPHQYKEPSSTTKSIKNLTLILLSPIALLFAFIF